jgi:hypothetical protein
MSDGNFVIVQDSGVSSGSGVSIAVAADESADVGVTIVEDIDE